MSTDEVRYQVFVSSTFTDLKDEREKVLQAILEQRAFPAGMELFPSADEEQFEFIKREIDSSDYYILIIAGRYGSLSEDGTSFTEKEYDYAVSKDKPILAFLHHDIMQLPGMKLESGEDGKVKLAAFREKARARRLVSFYQNPDDLKSKVLSSLASQFNLKPRRGWVRSGQTPREVLEQVNFLQQKVIDLEAENSRLRELQSDATTKLSGGEEAVTFSLDLNTFVFDNKLPRIRTLELRATWDELLATIFPAGTSFSVLTAVDRAIANLVVARLPNDEDVAFLTAAAPYLIGKVNPYYFPQMPVVIKLRSQMHRQFSGLGLIRDAMETVHVPEPFGGGVRARTMSTWRLTEKGETRLALLDGHLRSSTR